VKAERDQRLGDTAGADIWTGVDRLIDLSPGLNDLQAHGLHLLAARRWRSIQRPVPPELVAAELWAALRVARARTLLERIRATWDGPIVLIKGPAVGAHYPNPAVRPFMDVDLVVADPDSAYVALTETGFEPVPGPSHPDTVHHLHPLRLPEVPLTVELHRYPKWIVGSPPPSLDELVEGSELAGLGIDGILTPRPAYHAALLAAHVWSHDPFARLLRLLDVAVMSEAADARELERVIDAWGMSRPWQATTALVDALFRDGNAPGLALRIWGRNLRTAREATVFEMHIGRCLAPFSVLPRRRAARAAWAAVMGSLRPQPFESWGEKLNRTVAQLRRPAMRRSEHARRADPQNVNEALSSRPSWATGSLAWLGLTALWGGGAILAMALNADVALRAGLTLSFVLVCPGLALVRLLQIPPAARLSLALAVSLAVNVLVPAALLYAGAWSARAALMIVAGFAITLAAIEVAVRRGGRTAAT
jgi:Uncharacterised nucleotidyltransferase